LVGETLKIVLLQTALVAMAALALYLYRIRAVSSLQGPVGLVLLVFVLTYPLRLFGAVLGGLQDLKFLGQTRIWLWSITTAATVILLLMGARFYALAGGWCLQELAGNCAGLWRLRRIRPDWTSFSTWKKAGPLQWNWFTRGLWVSISQTAVWALNGVDLLIVARVLGPTTVVLYFCTSKLVTVLQNMPQTLAGIALPGLSQLKVSESRERTIKATICLTQGMLFVAGAVFTVVLALNQQFVNLWVGAKFFGGVTLTLLVVANFFVRLIDYTLALALFAFGYEKTIAIRFVADAVVSVGVATAMIGPLGLPGVAIGFLVGAACVAVPIDICLLAHALNISMAQVVQPYIPYVWRCGTVGTAAFVIMRRIDLPNLFALLIAGCIIGLTYLCVMVPYVWRSELSEYVRPAIAGLQSSVAGRVLVE